MKQREQLGYFTFEDGTKSTDPANFQRVKSVKLPTKLAKKTLLMSAEKGPDRVKSAYNFFTIKQFANNKRAKLSEIAQQWKQIGTAERQEFVALHE